MGIAPLHAKTAFQEPVAAHLQAPLPNEHAVKRTALVNRLRTNEAPVVLVTAPAGYGKTTLLAQWAERDPRPFAWVTLEPDEADPARVAYLVADAIAVAQPGTEVEDLVAEAGAAALRLPRLLANRLLDRDEPLVIVLDGGDHLVGPAQELVRLLAEQTRAGSCLVVSSRQAPLLPFARLRAEGRLLELTAADLRLSDREAEAALRDAGVAIGHEEAVDLNRRAEGWPTGISLSALALRPRPGRPLRAPSSVDGAHHFVAEYLAAEVLDGLDGDDRTFLVEASVLDLLSGPTCDDVLGAEGSGERLHRLADAGAFVVPVDRERTSFRLHTFLLEDLRSRIAHDAPSRFAELTQRAAAWYERRGDVPHAIEGHLSVGDRGEAARLLGLSVPEIVGRGLLDEIEPALAELGEKNVLLGHPSAAVAGAVAYAFLGRTAYSDRWAALADAAEPADGRLHVMRAVLCRDGVELMLRDAQAALRELPATSRLVPFATLLAGIAQLHAGRTAEAETSFAAALEAATAAEWPLVESLALAELALLAEDAGEHHRSESLASDARERAEALPEGHVARALAFAASARTVLRNSNWVRAGDDIAELERLLPHATVAMPWLAVQVRVELARVQLALNDLGAADETVAEAQHILLARAHMGHLRDQVVELRGRIEELRAAGSGAASTLTAAELRLLPLLTTHLTFRQIAERLYVSRNTIKTQAISIYRKLRVTSRAEAIDRATELGLLRPDPGTIELPD